MCYGADSPKSNLIIVIIIAPVVVILAIAVPIFTEVVVIPLVSVSVIIITSVLTRAQNVTSWVMLSQVKTVSATVYIVQ